VELLTTGDFEVRGFVLEPIKVKKINNKEYKYKIIVTEKTGEWLLKNHPSDFVKEEKRIRKKEAKINGIGE